MSTVYRRYTYPKRKLDAIPVLFPEVAGGIAQTITGAASISSSPATAGTVTANQVIPKILTGVASIADSPATAGVVVAVSTVSQELTGTASIASSDAVAGTVTAGQVLPRH